MAKNLSPKTLNEREQKIHALAKERGITRAAAAVIVDAEEAGKDRTAETPEQIAEQFKAEELKEKPPEPEEPQP